MWAWSLVDYPLSLIIKWAKKMGVVKISRYRA
jgi:hypothetical protein